MGTLQKKFIGANQVDGTKILLDNNQALRGRNAANSADIDLIKSNAADQAEVAAQIKVPSISLGTTPVLLTSDVGGGAIDAFTSLLLHSDNNITDASQYGNVAASDGVTNYVAGKFAQAIDYTGANSVRVPSLLAGGIFDLAGGDFELDCQIQTLSSGNQHFLNRWLTAGGDWFWVLVGPTTLRFGCPAIGMTFDATIPAINDGNFHQVAISRSGNTFRQFVDGVLYATVVNAGVIPFTPSTQVGIGAISDGYTDSFTGVIDEIRISKGIARYTASFTPPTEAYGSGAAFLELGAQEVRSSAAPTNAASLTNKTYVDTQDALAVPLTQKGAANGVATLDANTLIPITQIPPAALERLVIVADQAARFALTTATVQNGDTVKQTDTDEMYFVKDDTNLGNASGYEVYSAGTAVNFSGNLSGEVTGTQGATVVGNAAVIAKVLTGYVSGAGVVAPTDSILQAIQKLNGNIAAIPAGAANGKETITLNATDIANGYVDLAEEALTNSLDLLVEGASDQLETIDYSLSVVAGPVTRVTWTGLGLDGLLADGDIIQVKYLY